MGRPETSRWSDAGYVVVLLGTVVFGVSCFLPIYRVAGTQDNFRSTLYNQIVGTTPGTELVGGIIFLFGGLVAVAVASIFGLLGSEQRWSAGLLGGAVVVWSLSTHGFLIQVFGFGWFTLLVGYWLLLASVVVVLMGAAMVVRSSRQARRARREEPPEISGIGFHHRPQVVAVHHRYQDRTAFRETSLGRPQRITSPVPLPRDLHLRR